MITAIQRSTLLIAVVIATFLWLVVSKPAAIGYLIGAALISVNLLLLDLIARAVGAIARRRGGATRGAIMLAPLKMALLIGTIYFVVFRTTLNAAGFAAGLLTQMAAVLIETWRAAPRRSANPT
jgi:hypothetical protein